jgi:hypothetical protein
MVGVVMATYFAGLVAGSIYCVGLIQREGHIRTFAGLAAVASAASLAHLLIVTPVAWVTTSHWGSRIVRWSATAVPTGHRTLSSENDPKNSSARELFRLRLAGLSHLPQENIYRYFANGR